MNPEQIAQAARNLLTSIAPGARFDIGDDAPPDDSQPSDAQPVQVSATELLYGSGGIAPGADSPKTAPKGPPTVRVDCDWHPLKSVVLGNIENNVFAPRPWQPSIKGLPKAGGMTYERFAPGEYRAAIEQLNALAEMLIGNGVEIHRPPQVSLEEAMSPPVGLTQLYVRESFSVIGNTVFINQSRSPYRRKEARAMEGHFTGIAGIDIVHLPPAPDDIPDSPPDDPMPYLEGGDVYRLGKDVLITISGLATSPAGFRSVADNLAEKGITAWVAHLKEEYEHGDYILMLVREGLCIANRKGFVDELLPSPIMDWDCIEITSAEADPGMGANGIVLSDNLVVLQEGNRRLVRALEKKGVDVIEVPFDGVSFFQGSIDCSTNELWRESDAD
jgi:glycine amidinotransferase